jgi:uncharacterized protein YndB with AHSA1/START domain
MGEPDAIRWPPRYEPVRAAVHVRNEISIPAPAEVVWAWLIRAMLWPTWYRNSAYVSFVSGSPPDLGAGTRFSWKTFGVRIESTVIEFVPTERLAWDARGRGIEAYHAWLIRTSPHGCSVVTEETQHGWLARLGQLLMPDRMHRFHQVWLEALKAKAAMGMPPRESG